MLNLNNIFGFICCCSIYLLLLIFSFLLNLFPFFYYFCFIYFTAHTISSSPFPFYTHIQLKFSSRKYITTNII